VSEPSPQVAASGGRPDRLESLLTERNLDLLLVTHLVNVRYLSGFTGTNGLCLVGKGLRAFLTDFRYTERAAREVGDGWERPEVERELLPAVRERLHGRVGYEDAHLSARQLQKLEELAPEDCELVAAGDLVERLRRVKDEGELELISRAARIADQVYEWVEGQELAGRVEREVARAAEARIRELGAEPAFPAIVAAGANGALPHAEPGERTIGEGELVVFDMGAQLEGYCSDCTRTFAAGDPGDEARDVYDLVQTAQLAALAAVEAGAGGREVDAVARELIAAAGHGEQFGHGLGHGVGLEVHEAPRLSTKSEDVLEAGNAVTVEPGVYVPGRFGVRIEDLVAVTAEGYTNLSGRPKELTVVG
jgi:Xaa-Pro aminopeptidase